MPNNNLDKNVSEIVLKKFLPGFMDDLVLSKTVNRQLLDGSLNPNTGDEVQFKRPHQYRTERTPTGDVSAAVSSELISATATARVSDYITVLIEWDDIEEALELNQWEEVMKPARDKVVTELENELANFMLANAGLSLGDFAQAIDAWGDVAGTGSYLKALGVDGPYNAVMNPWAAQDLADTQAGLASGDNNLVNTAWQMAQISKNFGGVRAMMSNTLEAYTTGDATTAVVANAPDVTYATNRNTYTMTIDLTIDPNATLLKGQQLQFDATSMLQQQNKNELSRRGTPIPYVGTVTENVTADGAGAVQVVLSGCPFFDPALPQYNVVNRAIGVGDTITLLTAPSSIYQPGLFYTDGFVGMGTVDLPKLRGWDSSVVNHEGFSIRATEFSDPKANFNGMRLDLLPSFCVFNPFMGGQFNGNP